MNPFMTLKTTALAPMAMANVEMAAMANPGDLRNWRRTNRRSCSRMVMVGLWVAIRLHGKKGNSRAKVPVVVTSRTKVAYWIFQVSGTELDVRFHWKVSANEQGLWR